MKKETFVVRFILFLDVLGIGILVPQLPALMDYYDVTNFQITFGFAIYSICTFFAAPVLWQLSDKFWRKPLLWICTFGNIIGWLLLVVGNSYPLYLLSRILSWVVWWNISILQSILLDISKDETESKKNIWMFWAILGLGFVIWPVFWSFFAQFGIHWPFYFALVTSIIGLILVTTVLHETNGHIHSNSDKVVKLNPLPGMYEAITKAPTNILFTTLLLYFSAFFLYQSVFTLLLQHNFGIWPMVGGYIFACIWILVIINQSVLFPRVWMRYFTDNQLLKYGHMWSILLFTALAIFYQNMWIFFALMAVGTILSTILRPIYVIMITKFYEPSKRWQANWLVQSFNTLTMVIGSLAGGYFLDIGVNLFVVWALSITVSTVVLYYFLLKKAPVETGNPVEEIK